MKNVLKLKTMFFAIALLGIAFTSCEEDKKDETKADKTALLTEKNWKVTAMTVDPAIDLFGTGTPVTNVYAQMPACVKDDVTIFRKNGTVAFDEGGSKCAANDPQTRSGLWTFNTDQTIVSITEAGETDSWKIIELTKDRVKTEFTVQDEDSGITYTITSTYAIK